MQIEKNRVVSLHYTLRDEQGTVLDSSSGRAPLSYLHGKGNIIPGLEAALAGKGVLLAGSAFHGSGIDAAVRSAESAAARLSD